MSANVTQSASPATRAGSSAGQAPTGQRRLDEMIERLKHGAVEFLSWPLERTTRPRPRHAGGNDRRIAEPMVLWASCKAKGIGFGTPL